jgi:amino acid transporter
MAHAAAAVAANGSRGRLRRELRFWEAIALSIGIMAPTAAMALNGVAPAGLVGRAVPLAFLFAAIAIGIISYSFVQLTRQFNHAGSAYALAGATLGPRAGFFAGWALLATYSCFIAANIAEIGLFGTAFLDGVGIWTNPQ